ncbi:MAG: histidine kinase, partial [Spirochaetales bacterium]|nr:histidine kinase [Spirochaetales bacterium]
ATPIRKLATAAGRIAAGELEVDPVVSPTGDEVEALARSFGIMSASISSMLSDLKNKADLERRLREEERELMDKERALREALFISLQDQIQPHFLFNALNTIARMALFENARETERLSLALGRMFRYALGAPESMVRVDAELTIVREYLSFQSLRFGDRLSWTIDALPATLGFGIPRFTIQPFVENAVRHGIEPKEDGGTVSVGVRNRGSRLYIHVHDTGVGMSRPAGTGIGVENVRKRLELRYGAAATLTIRSVHGRGTEVSVSMPAEPMEAGGVSP